MEVSLQAAALGVAGLHDPGARASKVIELGEHLGLEALVVDREPRRRADLALEITPVEERGVVGDHGKRAPAARDRRQRSSSFRRRPVAALPSAVTNRSEPGSQ